MPQQSPSHPPLDLIMLSLITDRTVIVGTSYTLCGRCGRSGVSFRAHELCPNCGAEFVFLAVDYCRTDDPSGAAIKEEVKGLYPELIYLGRMRERQNYTDSEPRFELDALDSEHLKRFGL